MKYAARAKRPPTKPTDKVDAPDRALPEAEVPEVPVEPPVVPVLFLVGLASAPRQTKEVDLTIDCWIGQVNGFAVVWMLTPPLTRVKAGNSTVENVPDKSTACTVVSAGKLMSES